VTPTSATSHQGEPHAHQFVDAAQQAHAATLGMWAFLITEILFFGGLLTAYAVYRWMYPEAWADASSELDLGLGAFNTAVLIGSSLTMALAVHGAQTGSRREQISMLLMTILLGGVFLGVKVVEYSQKFEHHLVPGAHFRFPGAEAPHAELFFGMYFGLTGLHAAHMIVGLGLLLWLLAGALRGRWTPDYATPVENVGLYWHFVDIVWIFLFPLLYLVHRH